MVNMLETKSLRKAFGGLVAVNDVDLSVDKKSITMLIGPNGSGKTTLLNLVTGVLKPDEGRVIFEGKDITDWPAHERYRAGLARTFQIPLPFLKLTVLENLLVPRANPGESLLKAPLKAAWIEREEEDIREALNVLRQVALSDLWNEPAHKLGGAQLKLLELGRALMSGAKMIALDEPIGGVDPTYSHEIFSNIVKLKKNLGITFLAIEHRIDIALPYADHVYVMDMGRIIAEGDPDSVMNNPKVIEVYIG